MAAGGEQRETLRKELLELNNKRTKIESELKEWISVLGTVRLLL